MNRYSEINGRPVVIIIDDIEKIAKDYKSLDLLQVSYLHICIVYLDW